MDDEPNIDVGLLTSSRDLAEREVAPAEQDEILASGKLELIANLSMNPRLLPKYQAALARSSASLVRWYLASNTSLDGDLQEVLVQDVNEGVLNCLAANPSVQRQVLEVLVKYPNSHVRTGAAENPKLPEDLARHLAADPDFNIRYALAITFPLTPSVQAILENDLEAKVAAALLKNPAYVLGPSTPARYAAQHAPDFLRASAIGCDEEAVLTLAQHWNGSVATLIEACQLVEHS